MDWICNDCGKPFIITKSDRAYYYKNRKPIPCRCKACQRLHYNSPVLWYLNKDTGDLESVTLLRDDGTNIVILFHGEQRQMDSGIIGTRLYRTMKEALKSRPEGRQHISRE